jgi:hypothetical protein
MKASEEYISAWNQHSKRAMSLSEDEKQWQASQLAECGKVCNRYRAILFSYPNVVEVGVSLKVKDGEVLNKPCIVVNVTKKVEGMTEGLIPSEIEGFPTDVAELGIDKLLSGPPLTGPICPLRPGYSIAHKAVRSIETPDYFVLASGTLSCIVRDLRDSELLILSNNHVLANTNEAETGDEIMHPGPYYKDLGPLPAATLKAYKKIVFGGDEHSPDALKNRIDAAVARPIVPIDPDIPSIGIPEGVSEIEPAANVRVKMTGAMSGYKEGLIVQGDVSAKFSNFGGTGKDAYFEHYFNCQPLATHGDSGSLMLDKDGKALGLVFMAKFVDGTPTISRACRLQYVLRELGIELVTKSIWNSEYS